MAEGVAWARGKGECDRRLVGDGGGQVRVEAKLWGTGVEFWFVEMWYVHTCIGHLESKGVEPSTNGNNHRTGREWAP